MKATFRDFIFGRTGSFRSTAPGRALAVAGLVVAVGLASYGLTVFASGSEDRAEARRGASGEIPVNAAVQTAPPNSARTHRGRIGNDRSVTTRRAARDSHKKSTA